MPSFALLQRVAIAPSQRHGPTIVLTAEQQHYLYRVLRLTAGDRFLTLEPSSGWWLTVLDSSVGTATILEAIAANTELAMTIRLLLAMPKQGMDEVIRQVTEVGVAEIVPIISDRTILKPSSQKLERWQRIAQEAAEQSERCQIPLVRAPMPWHQALQEWTAEQSHCLICTARGDRPSLWEVLQSRPIEPNAVESITLAIGPEGGWTPAEVDGAIAVGYQPVSLGRRVLRAVTAPVVAMAMMMAIVEQVSSVRSETTIP
jgi:16S rRNA (uracil1498-N3)-methyltransferase